MRRVVTVAAAATALVCGVGVVFAQQERVLHEYFTPPGQLEQRVRGQGASSASQQPPRLKTRAPGDAPPLTLNVRPEELVHGEQGPQGARPLQNPQGGLDPRQASNALDSDTDQVDELNYFSSFDPSVIPYKRGVSQNRVIDRGGEWAFVVDAGTFEPVEVDEREPAPDEDVFWGTFLLRATPGARLPIPSVAPQQQILQVDTEPRQRLRIERDAADNYYVRPERAGLVRINFKLAVPRFYFTGRFDESVRWGELDGRELARLPEELERRARGVAGQLGLDAMPPAQALLKLIEHFRDFEGRPFPDNLRGQDLYVSIATHQIGVCRHRSFAFVITAAALGIPARYVYNEAHAFVEVRWPGQGWRRVDLGGAAQDVLMRAAEQQQRVHDGGARDPLPQPPAYQRELERLAEQERARQDRAGMGRGDGPGGGDGGGDNAGFDLEDGPMNRADDGAGQGAEASGGDAGEEDASGGGDDEPAGWEPPEEDDRAPTLVRVTSAPDALRRGDAFTLRGRLTAEGGRAVPERTVRAVLSAPSARGRGGVGGRVLGEGTTGMDGAL